MVELGDLELDEQFAEEAHEFEVDLNCVVVVNHNLTLEGINRSEHEELASIQTDCALEYEAMRSIEVHVGTSHEDLRRAATNLAMVGIVTRLHHWVSRFVRRMPSRPKPPKSKKPNLVKELELLNGQLGEGPVPVRFFWDLVNVRDSVIHGDSRAEWKDRNELRHVDARYTNSRGGAEIDAEQLKEAISNAVQQIKWYDAKFAELKREHTRD